MNRKFYSLFCLLSLPFLSQSQDLVYQANMITTYYGEPKVGAPVAFSTTILSTEVSKHIGKVVTLCGKVHHARQEKKENGEPALFKLSGTYINELVDIRLRFHEAAALPQNFHKDLLSKNVCITGRAVDGYDGPEIYVDTLSARKMLEEAKNTLPVVDTIKVDGQKLKLLSNAYLLQGPRWKEPVVTFLPAGSVIMSQKLQTGWTYVQVIENDGTYVKDQGMFGFINNQALGLDRKGNIDFGMRKGE